MEDFGENTWLAQRNLTYRTVWLQVPQQHLNPQGLGDQGSGLQVLRPNPKVGGIP